MENLLKRNNVLRKEWSYFWETNEKLCDENKQLKG